MKPDVYIKVRFKTSEEGGRKTPVKCKISLGPEYYACPLIGDKELEFGKFYVIPVKFLDIDLALPNLSVGKKIALWEGKEVAEGEILRIVVFL
jgi:hypothetical protein